MYIAAIMTSPWIFLSGISTSMARLIKIGPSNVRSVEKSNKNEATIIVLEYCRKYGSSFSSMRQLLFCSPSCSTAYLSSQCQCMVLLCTLCTGCQIFDNTVSLHSENVTFNCKSRMSSDLREIWSALDLTEGRMVFVRKLCWLIAQRKCPLLAGRECGYTGLKERRWLEGDQDYYARRRIEL